MNLNSFLLNKNATLLEALRLIDKNKYNFLFVIDDMQLLGVLTEGDIRRTLLNLEDVNAKINYRKDYKFISTKDNINDIITIFKDERVKFLPIVDDQNNIVNLISKEHLHIMLLEDINFDVNFDFLSLKESKINYEIYNKPWGFYKSTLLLSNVQSKIITVFPQAKLSLQEHRKREEHWVIIKGNGKVILSESILNVYPGRYFYIPKGCKHRIENTSLTENLIFSEVQLGEYFGEDDIIRHSDEYGR